MAMEEYLKSSEFLDLELESIPLDNLKNIKYPIQFSLEQKSLLKKSV